MLTTFLTFAMVAANWAASMDPTWWASSETTPTPNRAERAAALERGITNALYTREPDGKPWTVELKQDDANAWLAERLPRWVENRNLIRDGSTLEVRCRFAPGAMLFAGRTRKSGGITEIAIRCASSPTGPSLAIDSFAFGRLPVPRWLAVWTIESAFDSPGGSPRDPARSIVHNGNLTSDQFIIHLDDGRTVRIVAIEPIDRALRITCTTHPASSP
ncbi:MAG TPA: hypothetical protein VG797_10710 [Phycisphaerales bacterium]|nr:hypothetical protein [Phycisphaerales bacterium]